MVGVNVSRPTPRIGENSQGMIRTRRRRGVVCWTASAITTLNQSTNTSDSSYCSSSTSIKEDGGNDEANNLSVKIYPNPNSGLFYLEALSLDASLEIQVFNLQGEMLFVNSFNQKDGEIQLVDIQNYPNGIYFVKIINDDKVINLKLVKQ